MPSFRETCRLDILPLLTNIRDRLNTSQVEDWGFQEDHKYMPQKLENPQRQKSTEHLQPQ